MIHPPKITWNLEMMVSNRNLLFQGSIFRFHVCFWGCMCSETGFCNPINLVIPVPNYFLNTHKLPMKFHTFSYCLGIDQYLRPWVSRQWYQKKLLPFLAKLAGSQNRESADSGNLLCHWSFSGKLLGNNQFVTGEFFVPTIGVLFATGENEQQEKTRTQRNNRPAAASYESSPKIVFWQLDVFFSMFDH